MPSEKAKPLAGKPSKDVQLAPSGRLWRCACGQFNAVADAICIGCQVRRSL